MAGATLRPLADALTSAGLRTTGYDHRRTFANKQTVQSCLLSHESPVAPEFRRLVAVANKPPAFVVVDESTPIRKT